jgi:ABC-type Fe3+-hydroxamate transport system substrate-binding protein
MATDDLGEPVALDGPARRVVSLVPSLTESVAETGVLVGATDWCTHPESLEVPRVRGTKNPDLRAIVALEPDLVLANKEENREIDVRRLRNAGVPVWVTEVESVDQALTSLSRIYAEALRLPEPDWLADSRAAWSGEVPEPTLRVAIPIWRDPWMAVGSRTFTGDLVRRLGIVNVLEDDPRRYPQVDVAELDARDDLDLVLLPDEPYVFTGSDGPEAFIHTPTTLVSGRLLTWYGPSLLEARRTLGALVG